MSTNGRIRDTGIMKKCEVKRMIRGLLHSCEKGEDYLSECDEVYFCRFANKIDTLIDVLIERNKNFNRHCPIINCPKCHCVKRSYETKEAIGALRKFKDGYLKHLFFKMVHAKKCRRILWKLRNEVKCPHSCDKRNGDFEGLINEIKKGID